MSQSIHLVCPNCTATNRLKSSRLSQNPQCGKCHQDLFIGKPIELTVKNFNKHVKRNDIPVLVDFWAPWCGPCKTMGPLFEKAAQQLEPMVRFGKVNTEANQALGAQYAVRSIPTLILFHNGVELDRKSGVMNVNSIASWLQSKIKLGYFN